MASISARLTLSGSTLESMSCTRRTQASTSTPAQVGEDLEEADFYMQQGLLDEAEPIYRRILTAVPKHPQALLRLGEMLLETDLPPRLSVEIAGHIPAAELCIVPNARHGVFCARQAAGFLSRLPLDRETSEAVEGLLRERDLIEDAAFEEIAKIRREELLKRRQRLPL